MRTNRKSLPLWLKVTGRIFLALFLLIIVTALAIAGLWHNEIATIGSIQLLRDRYDPNGEGAVYTMKVSGGFYLDDFVAQGGVSNDQQLVDFIVAHFTKGLFDLEITTPEAGCSSFTAKTTSGDYLFGRNYDSDMTNVCIVFTEAAPGRHATFSSVDLKYLGIDPQKNIDTFREKLRCIAATYAPLDGMNDAGVACAIYISGQPKIPTDQRTDKPGFTPTTLIRLILDYADDLEEAIAIASAYDMHDSAGTTCHYMVADASGRSAILEWIGESNSTDLDGTQRRLSVTYCDSDADVGPMEAKYDSQVITNFIVRKDYYSDTNIPDDALARYAKMWEVLEKTDCILTDEQAAMDILEAVGVRNWAGRLEGTPYSIVFNLTERIMHWVPNENFSLPSAEYVFRFGEE